MFSKLCKRLAVPPPLYRGRQHDQVPFSVKAVLIFARSSASYAGEDNAVHP